MLYGIELTYPLYVQAYVYSPRAGNFVAFLVNYDSNFVARVIFNGQHFKIAPWSINILPDYRIVVFNTAKVINLSY